MQTGKRGSHTEPKGKNSVAKRRRENRRNSIGDEGLCKRVCLEDFFKEKLKPDAILERFQTQVEELEEEEIKHVVKMLCKTMTQIKTNNLQNKITRDNVMKILEKVTFFLKDDFIRDFYMNGKEGENKQRPDSEIILQACSLCFILFELGNLTDIDDYVNNVLFFWRKMFESVTKNELKGKELNDSKLYNLLEKCIPSVNEIIKSYNISLKNQTELIKVFISVILNSYEQSFQLAVYTALMEFYKKGEEFRALIINLTFKAIELTPNIHFRKNYKINKSISVSVLTIFILSFIEYLPMNGFETGSECTHESDSMKESFENIKKVSCFILNIFMSKANLFTDEKYDQNSYMKFFFDFNLEIVEICNEPDWPSARLLVSLFSKVLTDLLANQVPDNSQPSDMKKLAVKCLHAIMKKNIMDKNNFKEILDFYKHTCQESKQEMSEYAKTLLINYLNKKKTCKSNCKYLHAMLWFENMKNNGTVRDMTNFNDVIARYETAATVVNLERDEYEDIRAIVYYLDTTRPNYADYHTLLKYVLLSFNNTNKRVKAAATECILDLTTLDIDLLSRDFISKLFIRKSSKFPTLQYLIVTKIDALLTTGKTEGLGSFLLELLPTLSGNIKKKCLDAVLKTIKNSSRPDYKIGACCKVLCFINDENPLVQKYVVDFCTEMWLDHEIKDLDILLDLMENPATSKHLKFFFEEKLKPSTPSTESVSDPSQTFGTVKNLVDRLLMKITAGEKQMQCLKVISRFVTIEPKIFAHQLNSIAQPLTRDTCIGDNDVEILTAEILNRILSDITDCDRIKEIELRNVLIRKLSSPESADFSMGLIVSLLKILIYVSTPDVLFKSCFLPNFHILNENARSEATDSKGINKALCIVIYLHIIFSEESEKLDFPFLLDYYIKHSSFALTTIHSVCYLSQDFKSIIGNESVASTIEKYLTDTRKTVLANGALYVILCSVKNVAGGKLVPCHGLKLNDSLNPLEKVLKKNFINIMKCVLDEREEIRQTAYKLVKQLLASGLVPESKLIPASLVMSTDPVEPLSELGTEIIRQIPESKLFEYTRHATKCMIASYNFNVKFSNSRIARGFKGDAMEAVCSTFYLVHREEPETRRVIIDSLLDGLNVRSDATAPQKLFISDNLALLPYKYTEEVVHVLTYSKSLVSQQEQLPPAPGDEKETISFVDKYYGLYLLTFVQSTLTYSYGLNEKNSKRKKMATKKKKCMFCIPDKALPIESNMEHLPLLIRQALKKPKISDRDLVTYS